MTIKEIRDKDDNALKHELVEQQKHLFDLRSQAVTEKLEDPSQLGKTRREIARIKTIIRQRELDAQAATAKAAEKPAAPKPQSKTAQKKAAKGRAKATASA